MNAKHLVMLTLLPGLLLAGCTPRETPPAESPAEEVDEGNMIEDAIETVESAPDVDAEEALPEASETPADTPEEASSAPEVALGAPDMPEEAAEDTAWISLFDGETLNGWTVRGAAVWEVVDGVLTGKSEGGQGHIYADPVLSDLEVKGMFRITDQGGGANSGLYFRANPPEDNVDGYPNGYEAQICHNQDAFTGWLWKPGTPTGEATEMLTEDGEWFAMRVKAVGPEIQIWVNDELVMTYQDDEYTRGQFAIQCHNAGMTVEAKDLYYRDLGGQE